MSVSVGVRDIFSIVNSESLLKFLFSESAAIKNINTVGINSIARINFK
jgi:hypothetical protein